MGAIAAKYLARPDSHSIGIIGAGEQAKMHLIAIKTAVPSLRECRVASLSPAEEEQFIREMSPILSDMKLVAADTNLEAAADGADILVTATTGTR